MLHQTDYLILIFFFNISTNLNPYICLNRLKLEEEIKLISWHFVEERILFFPVKSHNPLVRNLKLAKNHEDFELKKLLINILVILSSDGAVLPVRRRGRREEDIIRKKKHLLPVTGSG